MITKWPSRKRWIQISFHSVSGSILFHFPTISSYFLSELISPLQFHKKADAPEEAIYSTCFSHIYIYTCFYSKMVIIYFWLKFISYLSGPSSLILVIGFMAGPWQFDAANSIKYSSFWLGRVRGFQSDWLVPGGIGRRAACVGRVRCLALTWVKDMCQAKLESDI